MREFSKKAESKQNIEILIYLIQIENSMGNLLTLEEVSQEYPIILVDTCALNQPLTRSASIEIAENSAIFFKNFSEGGGIYVTKKILKEYTIPDKEIEKIQRQKRSRIKYSRNNTYKSRSKKIGDGEVQRGFKKMMVEKKNLDRHLKRSHRVIKLSEDEIERYEMFYGKYSYLNKKVEMHSKAYDLLISGLVVSQTRSPACLVSNDFSLLYSWKNLLMNSKIDPSYFGFFIRKKIEGFQRAYT